MRNNKRRKFEALYEIFLSLKNQLPYSAMTLLELCATIVEMPAPEWFIDYQSASRIINDQMALRNEQIASKYGRK
jgi:hypothetical protein